MIEKITELEKNRMWAGETAREILCNKINELVDYVNTLCQEHDIHEEQIDELQMKLEPHKCEPVENAHPTAKTTYNVVTGEMEAPEDQSVGALIKSMGITFEEFLTKACDILSKK